MRTFLLASLLATLPTAAVADPLTFDDALAVAAAQAPSLKARSFDAEARRSSATAAGQLPDPRLGAGLDNVPISGPPAFRFGRDEMTMARPVSSPRVLPTSLVK